MRIKSKIFIDPKPILGHQEDFNLKELKKVYRDLTEYFKMPIEEISKDYWTKRETIDKELQNAIENTSTEKEIIEYYKNTRQYLYELTLWEAQKDKQRELKKLCLFCKRFNVKKILDFGGGTGVLCIYLNNHGLRCDYSDIPGQTYNFARWRFNRRKINLKILSAFENFSQGYYDAVIAYDVFEHIFDLSRIIKKINSCLVAGGYLISKSTFSGGGLHLSKNGMYQNLKNFNGLLSDNGFQFLGQLKADRFSRIVNKIGFRYFLMSIRISKRLKHGGNFVVHRKNS